MALAESAGVPMAKIRTESVPLLAPLSSSDGEKHAEYRRRRDDLIYERVACLTMPEIKGGIVRSHLIGKLAQKRKIYVGGPLAAETDERSVERATLALGLFFDHIDRLGKHIQITLGQALLRLSNSQSVGAGL